jgi:hypothetical protein
MFKLSSHALQLVSGVLAVGCHTGERTVPVQPPRSVVDEPLDADVKGQEAPADETARDETTREIAFGATRVRVSVPPGVEQRHDAVNDVYTYDIAWRIVAQLRAIDEPAPEAFALMSPGSGEGRILDAGRTEQGLPYSIQTFEVRHGAPSARGQVHWMEWVARVLVALPIDGRRHIECTGFLERSVEDADDDDLQRLFRLCTSMRHFEGSVVDAPKGGT